MEVMLRLLAEAYVFLTNVRMASIERLGLDYETLHARFPRLIYCHFTGFGYAGPEAARPGFDSAAFWSMPGTLGDLPQLGDRPMMPPGGFGDMVTSNCAVSGIVAALYHRDRTGEGVRLTTSLYAAGIWCNFFNVVSCQDAYNFVPVPRRAEDEGSPLELPYQCADGRWLLLVATYADQYARCMEVLGLPELIDDPRFNTFERMHENRRELFAIVTGRMLTKTSDEWAELLLKADIVHQKLMTANEVSKSEQAWANGYLTHVEMADGVNAVVPTSPVSFFGWERPATQRAHEVGADSSKILARYGYSPEEIEKLFASGAVHGE
jgi:crotonobetainyl-CoA:carnitine CoA-transferase CaiB-like acyl-CoA transferase